VGGYHSLSLVKKKKFGVQKKKAKIGKTPFDAQKEYKKKVQKRENAKPTKKG